MKLSIAVISLSFLISASATLNQENGIAYCSYHMYSASEPLTDTACSDGQYGLMTRWKYSQLKPMFPYVTAWDKATWNSPKCGSCIQVTWNGKSIYVTVIDQCGGPTAGHDTHLDISKEAFQELFGNEGIQKGTMTANWAVVANTHCKGNLSKTVEE